MHSRHTFLRDMSLDTPSQPPLSHFVLIIAPIILWRRALGKEMGGGGTGRVGKRIFECYINGQVHHRVRIQEGTVTSFIFGLRQRSSPGKEKNYTALPYKLLLRSKKKVHMCFFPKIGKWNNHGHLHGNFFALWVSPIHLSLWKQKEQRYFYAPKGDKVSSCCVLSPSYLKIKG